MAKRKKMIYLWGLSKCWGILNWKLIGGYRENSAKKQVDNS